MNKKLLALAIGTAAALPVVANAAGPTLYGKLFLTVDHAAVEYAADTYGAVRSTGELNTNASRLGVKGDYGLDVGDLKALYYLEYEVDADDGTTPFAQRNIYAGLQGDFGTLRMGMFDDPVKTSEGKVDQFNDLPGDIDSFVGGQNRTKNTVEYATPKFGDAVTVKVASILPEETDVTGDGRTDDGYFDTLEASVVYDKEAIYAALAYGMDAPVNTAASTADGFTRGDVLRLVGQYRASAFEVGALLQVASDNATGSSKEDTSMVLSGAVILDRVKLKAQYGTTEGDTAAAADITVAGLGVDYTLAKNTRAMAYVTQYKREPAVGAKLENNVGGVGLEVAF